MFGLIQYLAGPGRKNEHTNVHVVCASEQIVSVLDREDLDPENTRALGHEMNFPKEAFQARNDRNHVLHVSLSLDPDQLGETGERSDEFWDAVSRKFLSEMGLVGTDGKSPCRWVAIRHGFSENGNDHVHLAVSMIREDGTWWSDFRSKKRSQDAARVIERQFGLRILGNGLKMKGTKPGELESVARRRAEAKYTREAVHDSSRVPWRLLDKAARDHLIAEQSKIEQPRIDIARRIRAAGAGALSEAEYVQRLRGAGLLVRPYFAKGTTDKVAGYSVALRSREGERPIWYGGGTLARDLSLPALRMQWPGADPAEAVAEWKAAGRNRAFATEVDSAREMLSADVVHGFFREMKEVVGLFRDVRATDPARFAQIARQGAGVLSAWSVAAGAEGDAAAKELRRAADLFARHAQLAEHPKRAVAPARQIIANVATHQAISLSRRAGASAVLGAWIDFGEQLGKAFKAHGFSVRESDLAHEVRARLLSVQRGYLSVNSNPIGPAPDPVKTGTGTPASTVAVAERAAPGNAATEVASTRVLPEQPAGTGAQQQRERIAALEKQLRAAGVPEQTIRARLQSEKIMRTGRPTPGGQRIGPAKPQQAPSPTQQSKNQQKGRGL